MALFDPRRRGVTQRPLKRAEQPTFSVWPTIRALDNRMSHQVSSGPILVLTLIWLAERIVKTVKTKTGRDSRGSAMVKK